MKTNKISILLPTRKRTKQVINSIGSLLASARDTSRIEILIVYDDDDQESREFFRDVWPSYIAQCEATTRVFESERFGYTKLNRYVNFLGEESTGDIVMFWNDDALMLTDDWDLEIDKGMDNWWGCLRMPCTTMRHPFALFPIFPREWIDLFGCISPVTHSDWWIYHVTKHSDCFKDIPVYVYHDRADVTGNNNDETYRETSYSTDGKDPTNPDDYSHPERQKEIHEWILKLREKLNGN